MSARGDFWARRKAAVQAEQEAEVRAALAREQAVEKAALEEKSDEEICKELGLPDPDTLEPGANIADFMKAAVPDRLRRRALRQLWRINPAFAVIDELVEYGEDYTDAALVVENLQTTYQVGKGMLRHVEEMARQEELRRKAEAGETDVVEDETPDAPDTEEMTVGAVDAPQPAAETTEARREDAPAPPDAEPEFIAPPRRRIRFAFEDSTT